MTCDTDQEGVKDRPGSPEQINIMLENRGGAIQTLKFWAGASGGPEGQGPPVGDAVPPSGIIFVPRPRNG
ncbi:hypothetical protein AVEN_207227-1, partial [Araneus ventricosus]